MDLGGCSGANLASELDIDTRQWAGKPIEIQIPIRQRLDENQHPVADIATERRFFGSYRIDVDGIAIPSPASEFKYLILCDLHLRLIA
jgi:hypothetical protein